MTVEEISLDTKQQIPYLLTTANIQKMENIRHLLCLFCQKILSLPLS